MVGEVILLGVDWYAVKLIAALSLGNDELALEGNQHTNGSLNELCFKNNALLLEPVVEVYPNGSLWEQVGIILLDHPPVLMLAMKMEPSPLLESGKRKGLKSAMKVSRVELCRSLLSRVSTSDSI